MGEKSEEGKWENNGQKCVCAKSLQLYPTPCKPYVLQPTRLLSPWDSPGKNKEKERKEIYSEERKANICGSSAYVKVKLLSCVQLFGTPWVVAHGIFQARVLEWVTISFSRGSS